MHFTSFRSSRAMAALMLLSALSVTTAAAAQSPARFEPATHTAVGSTPSSIAVADFNHDGFQDAAVAAYQGGQVTIHLGEQGGLFSGAGGFGIRRRVMSPWPTVQRFVVTQ